MVRPVSIKAVAASVTFTSVSNSEQFGDEQFGDSIPIHQGSGTGLHRNTVAIPVGEQLNLLQYASCQRIRPQLFSLRQSAGV
jgi:hypothetical protein